MYALRSRVRPKAGDWSLPVFIRRIGYREYIHIRADDADTDVVTCALATDERVVPSGFYSFQSFC